MIAIAYSEKPINFIFVFSIILNDVVADGNILFRIFLLRLVQVKFIQCQSVFCVSSSDREKVLFYLIYVSLVTKFLCFSITKYPYIVVYLGTIMDHWHIQFLIKINFCTRLHFPPKIQSILFCIVSVSVWENINQLSDT